MISNSSDEIRRNGIFVIFFIYFRICFGGIRSLFYDNKIHIYNLSSVICECAAKQLQEIRSMTSSEADIFKIDVIKIAFIRCRHPLLDGWGGWRLVRSREIRSGKSILFIDIWRLRYPLHSSCGYHYPPSSFCHLPHPFSIIHLPSSSHTFPSSFSFIPGIWWEIQFPTTCRLSLTSFSWRFPSEFLLNSL